MKCKNTLRSHYSFLFESESSESKRFSDLVNHDESLQNKIKIVLSNNSLPSSSSISNSEQAITFFLLGDIIFSYLSGLDSLLLPDRSTSSDISTLTSTEGISIKMIMTNPNFKTFLSIYDNFKERIENDTALKKIVILFRASLLFFKNNDISHILLEQEQKLKISRAKLKYVINLSKRSYMSEKEIKADRIVKAISSNLIKTINIK